jgi:hypothetical protein
MKISGMDMKDRNIFVIISQIPRGFLWEFIFRYYLHFRSFYFCLCLLPGVFHLVSLAFLAQMETLIFVFDLNGLPFDLNEVADAEGGSGSGGVPDPNADGLAGAALGAGQQQLEGEPQPVGGQNPPPAPALEDFKRRGARKFLRIWSSEDPLEKNKMAPYWQYTHMSNVIKENAITFFNQKFQGIQGSDDLEATWDSLEQKNGKSPIYREFREWLASRRGP